MGLALLVLLTMAQRPALSSVAVRTTLTDAPIIAPRTGKSLLGSRDSMKMSQVPTVAGCKILPTDDIWNTPVDSLPKDASSTAYVNTIGASEYVHADFGSGEWPPGSGAPIGNQNALKTGAHTRKAIEERRRFSELIRLARKTLAEFE